MVKYTYTPICDLMGKAWGESRDVLLTPRYRTHSLHNPRPKYKQVVLTEPDVPAGWKIITSNHVSPNESVALSREHVILVNPSSLHLIPHRQIQKRVRVMYRVVTTRVERDARYSPWMTEVNQSVVGRGKLWARVWIRAWGKAWKQWWSRTPFGTIARQTTWQTLRLMRKTTHRYREFANAYFFLIFASVFLLVFWAGCWTIVRAISGA